MPSQFENAGLGMFGREGQFSRGGPVNELVKLLPAAGLAYGLIKSGAVDKANMGGWFSNPTKALGNAITGSAPAPSTAQPTAVSPTSTGQDGMTNEQRQSMLEQGAADVKSWQPGSPSPVPEIQPASDPNKDVDSVFKSSMTNSGVTSDPLNNASQQANSNTVLQAAYTPVAPPNNQQQQSGGGGGGSAISALTSLISLFA